MQRASGKLVACRVNVAWEAGYIGFSSGELKLKLKKSPHISSNVSFPAIQV
jgi:hypothetical protein